MAEPFDIVIIGGGPIGCAVALALRDCGRRQCLLEARAAPEASDDPRALAVSYGSRLILERLGVWTAIDPLTPIESIIVTQQGGLGRVTLTAEEAGVPALGYVTGYASLQRALAGAVPATGVEVWTGTVAQSVHGGPDGALVEVNVNGAPRTLAARLAVVADGGHEERIIRVDTRPYDQVAVVAEVASEIPHRQRAFERFTAHGPLALLPHRAALALVWTVTPQRGQELLALEAPAFCQALHAEFGAGVGAFVAVGPRQSFPLALKVARTVTAERVALIGNAAQTLHPVAGQGFNLGLRDAWELGREIVTGLPGDPGAPVMLASFLARRRGDRSASIAVTDSLVRLFSNDLPLLRAARGLGLVALGAVPPAKKILMRRMMFGARG